MLARYAAFAAIPLTVREAQGLVPPAAASLDASGAENGIVAALRTRKIEASRDNVTGTFSPTLVERNLRDLAVTRHLQCTSA